MLFLSKAIKVFFIVLLVHGLTTELDEEILASLISDPEKKPDEDVFSFDKPAFQA